MELWDKRNTSTVRIAAELQKLQEMGVGPEGVRQVTRTVTHPRTKSKTEKPGISYVPPVNLSRKDRSLEVLRELTGINLKPTKSGAVRDAVKAEFFSR